MLLNWFKKRTYPIGIDIGSGHIKIAQLGRDDDGLVLHAAATCQIPDDIVMGTAEWQRWVAETSSSLIARHKFVGKDVIAAMPSEDIIIEQFQIPRMPAKQLNEAVNSKVSSKLPLDVKNDMIKYVYNDNGSNGHLDVLLMGTKRENVDHNLAIYEKAGLSIKGMGVWPAAYVNVYTNFFGRRQADKDKIVLLLEIGKSHTNVIICHHHQLLFARLISLGFEHIHNETAAKRFISEIDACWRYYESNNKDLGINKIILLSDRNVSKDVCDKIAEYARAMQVPAQIGDVIAAVHFNNSGQIDIERRGAGPNWAMAFGLSLEGKGI